MATDIDVAVPDDGVAPPPVRPRVWSALTAPFLALIVTVLLQGAFGAVLAAHAAMRGVPANELSQRLVELLTTPGLFILVAALGQLAFGLTAWTCAWLSPVPARERLGLVPMQHAWTIYPLTMMGSLLPLSISFALATGLAQVLPVDPSVRMLYDKLTPSWAVAFVLFIAIAPGFCEELLFRGYVQGRLLQRWRPTTAIVVTSVIFALMHITPHAVLVALPLGLWLGLIAWRTGSIFACIACHAFINGSVNLWRVIVKFGQIPDGVQWIVVTTTLIAGLACFVVSWRTLLIPNGVGNAEPLVDPST